MLSSRCSDEGSSVGLNGFKPSVMEFIGPYSEAFPSRLLLICMSFGFVMLNSKLTNSLNVFIPAKRSVRMQKGTKGNNITKPKMNVT